MKKSWSLLLAAMLLASCVVFGQRSTQKFTMPKGISQDAYHAGKVWVKLKKEFAIQQEASGRVSSLLPGQMKPLKVGNGSTAKSGRVQAFKPTIDLSLYYEISFDKTKSVEAFINELYATGYIEYAEPAYREKMQFTPNDPSLSSQYFISKIKAQQAWDITKGSAEIIIGIIDSGVDIDHPDLVNTYYINEAEANGIPGVDDDNNGYTDDIRGWDFSGADTLNAFNPDFVGDNDPSINKSGPGYGHGTQVGGCAGASTNNGIGVAGVGFNTKLLFTKHFADNQPTSDRSYSSNLYQGVLYAAENGAKIINCSWGGEYRSQVYQDIITYVTLDLGCLVVAAAGNENTDAPLYPAAYEYVLSVAATDKNDKRASFSNYGTTIDISAPGVAIFTTRYDNAYGNTDGTSFASPIVAGAAALVWAVFPDYTPLQVAEQLRVTADETMYTANAAYVNKLGKGRLDVFEAVTKASPSIRALNYKLVNELGNSAEPGDNALLYFDFINYLSSSSSGLTISISTTSTDITITKGSIAPGAIASGATVRNTITPFELSINSSVGENTPVILTITYSDGSYQDTQSFSFVPNPSYRDIDDNKVLTTLSGTGRIGFDDPQNSDNGIGFLFNDKSILYEMGIMMGSSATSILNNVRGEDGEFDQDFVSIERIREQVPGTKSYSELYGQFSNSRTPASQRVLVNYRSMVWREAPNDQFIILEYKIKNTQSTTLSNFYFGMFADWDISYNGANDAARWNAETKLGYIYPKQSDELPHAGVQVLTGNPNYFAIDNSPDIDDNPFGLYDGYSDLEKYTSLSSGLERIEAGNTTETGNDVSQVVSSGPYTIAPNEEITVAFALHASNNLDDLILSSKYADSVYNYTLKAAKPMVTEVETCFTGSATVTATGASSFKWYKNFTGGEPIATGNQVTINNLLKDTTLYVSNAAATYESVRTPANIKVKAKPEIFTSRSTTLCEGEEISMSVAEATSYLWSNGATTQSIAVTEPGNYSVEVIYTGNGLDCQTDSETIGITVLPSPVASFTAEASTNSFEFNFTDISDGTITNWFWNFGDGTTASTQNPTHSYDNVDTYDVELTVTAENGCQNKVSQSVSIILSDEEKLAKAISVYPVPAENKTITIKLDGVSARNASLLLMDSRGSNISSYELGSIDGSFSKTITQSTLKAGIYFLKCTIDGNIVVKKVSID